MTLMPGVSQPYMMQAGGINNPARSMGVSVNGQPPNNTVFRIDGANSDQSVVSGHPVVQSRNGGRRDGQRRHQQLRRGSGHGRRRRRKCSSEEREPIRCAICLRVPDRLSASRTARTSCPSGVGKGFESEAHLRRDRLAGPSFATNSSTSSAWRAETPARPRGLRSTR